MAIRREIYVTQKRLDVCIDVTYGSDLIPIVLKVADYTIPSGAAVTAYSIGKKDNLRKQICSISDNEISFTPQKGFFDEGTNVMQIRVTYDDKDLISFEIFARCQKSIVKDDVEEIEKQPSLVTQLLTKMGNLFKAIADEATERKNADAAEESARKQADAKEKTERQAEIAVERERIDQIVALGEGGDFVIEQGVSGIWWYRKWNSGIVECWGQHSVTVAIDTLVGNCYRSEIQYAELPFTVYNVQYFVDCTDLNTWASNGPSLITSLVSIPYLLWRGSSYQSYTWCANIFVIGRWKE